MPLSRFDAEPAWPIVTHCALVLKQLTHSGSGGSGSGGASGSGGGGGSGVVSRVALPDNLHSMSLPQIRAVAASNGVLCPAGASVDEIIAALEKACDAGSAEPLRLEEKSAPKPKPSGGKRAAEAEGSASKSAGKKSKKAWDDDSDEYVQADDDDDD